MMDINHKLFGEYILLHRRRAKLTQQELADLASVSRNYISMIERGIAVNMSIGIAVKIADALKIPILDLIGALMRDENE